MVGSPYEYFNQVLWADAVYVRDFREFHTMPSAQLRKLAVVLSDVFGSIDFALNILMELDRRDGTALAAAYLDTMPKGGKSS